MEPTNTNPASEDTMDTPVTEAPAEDAMDTSATEAPAAEAPTENPAA